MRSKITRWPGGEVEWSDEAAVRDRDGEHDSHRKHTPPADLRRPASSRFQVSDWLRTKNAERVVELLENKPDVYSPGSSLWKLKTLYYSCLDDYANMRTAGLRMVHLIGKTNTLLASCNRTLEDYGTVGIRLTTKEVVG